MIALHPLRLNPPNHRYSFDNMSDDAPFVVRPLPSSTLDGAFRVHLSPDGLDKVGLKMGDLCQITGDNGGSGFAIAWRAMDKMGNNPKLRPAKMSDTLRHASGFKEGSHVTIARSTAKVQHAVKVTLTDVTPSEYGSTTDAEHYGRWRMKCANLLADAEAVAVGTTFDVTAKKGLRKRFYIDHIEPVGTQAGTLYFCDDETGIVFSDGAPIAETPVTTVNGEGFPALDVTGIGGLVDQVKELNMRLDRVLNKTQRNDKLPKTVSTNRHVLIHGYEGTGKSLLLDRLEQTSACKVYRLQKADLVTGKIQSSIQSTFKEAMATQPSIVIMDDLDELASPENKVYANSIGREMNKLRGHSIMVVAATRAPTNIDSKLTGPGSFSRQIELPIPNASGRKQILNVLLGKPAEADDPATTMASLRTHGFTGKDLGLLVEAAVDNAFVRLEDNPQDWIKVHARVSMLNGENSHEQGDGSADSQASTAVESDLTVTESDFEIALSSGAVRPTALREIFLETPKVRWSDIGGSESQKQRFDEIIGWPLHHPEMIEQLDLPAQKGVLLYGPPGCSKTMTAQAVAATYKLNFIAVKGAELISMYVGESERAVREVFRKAKQAAPCVIFFDEIDSIGSERESGGAKGLNVLTTLLNEMDGFEAMKDVLVLAATNKPEVLDPALLRPGRFDQHVYVGLPNTDARKDILQISLRKVPVATNDLDSLVAATEGFSGAEIVGICGVAKRAAARRMIAGATEVQIEEQDLRDAIAVTRKGVTEEMLKSYDDFAKAGAC
ncbi:hypothetical protein D0863_04120 [Hortaea werneckii]|uniref:AAA+ ATPase domain-containing protein n=1 Tax=Hortaea werneckii TaxID=91943 RepID=A0A3M7E977_HORWE|nr:hypothetical protein D0863_04120 [Hortaea werneckii]